MEREEKFLVVEGLGEEEKATLLDLMHPTWRRSSMLSYK